MKLNPTYWTTGLFFISVLAACSTHGQASPVLAAANPGTIESRDQLYLHLQDFDGIALGGDRDASYRPEAALPALNSWFTTSWSGGLYAKNFGSYSAMMLRKIPNKVIKQVENITFDDAYPSGFLILQSAFWHQVSDLQKAGFTIGFLEPKANQKIAGIFFNESNVILVDVFAPQGTLTHEYRHYQQYKKHQERNNSYFSFKGLSRVVSDECVAQASSFFGELDATTVELPTWVGVFQTYEVSPAWHKSTTHEEEDITKYPLGGMLMSNLSYPSLASLWVKRDQCPEALNKALDQISHETDAFLDEISEPVNGLAKARFNDYGLQQDLVQKCVSKGAAGCAELQTQIEKNHAQARADKALIDQKLNVEARNRPDQIRKVLAALPEEIREDLCWHASSFEFLTDCSTYFKNQ